MINDSLATILLGNHTRAEQSSAGWEVVSTGPATGCTPGPSGLCGWQGRGGLREAFEPEIVMLDVPPEGLIVSCASVEASVVAEPPACGEVAAIIA